MGYVLLASLFLVILIGLTAVFLKLLLMEREANRNREISWEHERERLLNRAMSREWQTFVQVEGNRNQGPSFASPSDPYIGMSDEEEAAREHAAAVAALAGGYGLGEVINDDLHNDAVDLGLTPDGI